MAMNKRPGRSLICGSLAVLVVAGQSGCGAAGTGSAGGTHRVGGGSHAVSRAALTAILRGDLTRYLADRGQAEHMSAVGLTITLRGNRPGISLAAGTTRYGGGADLSAAKVVSYAGAAVTGDTWLYSNTNYILAQLIIEKVTHDSYSDQLARRITVPLGLRSLCFAPSTCPAADPTRMPAGYFFDTAVADHEPPNPLASLLGKPVPALNLSEYQGAGAIISSLQDMATWDRALYQGELLPPAQQRQLESLVSTTTGRPIAMTTPATPLGYGLGVIQETYPPFGTVWGYEGETLGFRVLHLYFPRSGLIIALAANSQPVSDQDDLFTLAASVYQALQKAGLG